MSKKKHRVVKYENGNYTVDFNTKTGVKTKRTSDDSFRPDHPELLRVRAIGDEDTGMPWDSRGECDGVELGESFYDALHPHQEIVLSTGIMQHSDVADILEELHQRECIASLRMTQREFTDNLGWLVGQSIRGLLFGVDVVASKPDDTMFDAMKRFRKANLTMIAGTIDNDSLRGCLGWGGDVLLAGIPDTPMGRVYKVIHRDEIAKQVEWEKRFVPRLVPSNCEVLLDLGALDMFGYANGRNIRTIEQLTSEAISDSMFIDLVSGVCALGDAFGEIRQPFALREASDIDTAFQELQVLAKEAEQRKLNKPKHHETERH